MHRPALQILRMIGLFVEMLGILAFVVRSRSEQAGRAAGWITMNRALGVVVLGFVLWLIASVMLYWPRKRVRPPDRPDDKTLRL